MSINIGDKNKITNSSIGHKYSSSNHHDKEPDNKKSFATEHPVITSAIVSVFITFTFLFSFWKDIINWMENFFK